MIARKDNSAREKKVFDTDKVKCSSCNQELGSFSKQIEGHQNVLCEACYQNLMFPFSSNSYELMLNRY